MSRYRVLKLVLECEKLIEQHDHNGQWSMVNACTPQCELFWAPAVAKKKKNPLCTWVCMQFISRLAEFQECTLVMVAFRFLQPWPQTFVSIKNLDVIVPGVWAPSQGLVSDR